MDLCFGYILGVPVRFEITGNLLFGVAYSVRKLFTGLALAALIA